MAAHSSTLAWKIPWMEELVGYSPWGCRVGRDWETSLSLFSHYTPIRISESLITPNAGEDAKWQELLFIAGGNAKWYSHFGRQSEISHKTEYRFTIQSRDGAPCYSLKWVENLSPHKNLHTKVYSNFIQSCQKLASTKMPFSRWIKKYHYSPVSQLLHSSCLFGLFTSSFPGLEFTAMPWRREALCGRTQLQPWWARSGRSFQQLLTCFWGGQGQRLEDTAIPGFWFHHLQQSRVCLRCYESLEWKVSDNCQIHVDHSGKLASGNKRRWLWACGCGHSYSRAGGDRDYGSDRCNNWPGGYGYGHGRSRDYGGRSQGGYDHYLGGNYRDNYDNWDACTSRVDTQGIKLLIQDHPSKWLYL